MRVQYRTYQKVLHPWASSHIRGSPSRGARDLLFHFLLNPVSPLVLLLCFSRPDFVSPLPGVFPVFLFNISFPILPIFSLDRSLLLLLLGSKGNSCPGTCWARPSLAARGAFNIPGLALIIIDLSHCQQRTLHQQIPTALCSVHEDDHTYHGVRIQSRYFRIWIMWWCPWWTSNKVDSELTENESTHVSASLTTFLTVDHLWSSRMLACTWMCGCGGIMDDGD